MTTSRRDFLLGSGAALASLGVPRIARPGSLDQPRKFIFVFAIGGWDPTMTFAPDQLANDSNDTESDAEFGTVGNIPYVDHADRPSVRTFMEQYYDRMCILNGVNIPSTNHDICRKLTMTGSTAGDLADWPTIIGAARSDFFDVPHLLLSGLAFPGDLGVAVTRTGAEGQLQALLSKEAIRRTRFDLQGPTPPAESIMDDYLLRRAAARSFSARSAREKWLTDVFDTSMDRLDALKTHRNTMSFETGSSLPEQMGTAAVALSTGVSRCVTISLDGWDTHSKNYEQVGLWEEMFAGLAHLMFVLDNTPGQYGGMLADETNVVVLSEMGRAPAINVAEGKDHWPYTCQILIGPDFTGNRVVGGYDTYFNGVPVSPHTGEIDIKGAAMSMNSVGASMLIAADIDPGDYLPGIEPMWALLN
jgi:hypothetical protein